MPSTIHWGQGTSTDEYVYNALGQAMEYQPDGYARQAMVYDGNRLLEYRYASSGGIKGRYTNESGSYFTPWQSLNTPTTARFPLYDAVGSAPRLVDETGTVKYSQTLDAFGVPRTAGYGSDSPANWQRYGGAWGYLTSYNMGMMRLGARFYWPEIGRFVSQDPIGDGVNWYAYVGSNPLVGVDPEGLDYVDAGGHVGLVSFGLQMGNPPPCAPPPPWWDILDISRKFHPYVGLGLGLRAGATYAPGNQFPKKGLYGNASGGWYAGVSVSHGIGNQGGWGYGFGGQWGGSGAINYVFW